MKITTDKTIKDPASGMCTFNKKMIKHLALRFNCGSKLDNVSFLVKRTNMKVNVESIMMAEGVIGESYLKPLNNHDAYASCNYFNFLHLGYPQEN